MGIRIFDGINGMDGMKAAEFSTGLTRLTGLGK
jgi:hypothetical protein